MISEALQNEFSVLQNKLSYLNTEQSEQLEEAFTFAAEAHKGQTRRSGEPYISHPLRVAIILSEYVQDTHAVMAALLHDVLEDTHITRQQLVRNFGEDVANIVDGVSKLNAERNVHYKQKQAVNFQKMTLAMARDLRVILVKLADRLHNMRTMQHMPPEKAKLIAQETLLIYAPLAHRLGITNFYTELEDTAFKAIYPMRSSLILKAVNQRRLKNRDYVDEIQQMIQELLERNKIRASVNGRRKHIAGIYFKMVNGFADNTDNYYQGTQQRRTSSFNDIMDVHGFRIITNSVDNCYVAMGLVHSMFRPLPGRFKDYIAVPKSNGYQSLHTTVLGLKDFPIEFQIRTKSMHDVATLGVAAHWNYKEKKSSTGLAIDRWIADIPNLNNATTGAEDFFMHMRMDLNPSEVFVFSPDGDVFSLPHGATPVDFAYAIHTDVGNHCVGCTVDGIKMPLSTKLKSGQRVNVLTNPDASPQMSWRNFVVSAKALSGVGVFFKNQRTNDSIVLGKQLLDTELRRRGRSLHGLDVEHLNPYLARNKFDTLDTALERLGMGKALASNVADDLLHPDETTENQRHSDLVISRANANKLTFARCCQPVYGDNVIAILRTDAGIVIHRRSCANTRRLVRDPTRCMYAHWGEEEDVQLPVSIRLDVTNQPAMVSALASTITTLGVAIVSLDTTEKDAHIQTLTITVLVDGRYHLSKLLRKLRRLADVHQVARGN